MKMTVIVLPGGKIEIRGDEGSFEEARARTEHLLQLLAAKGIPAVLEGQVEQHRDGGSHVHVVEEVRHDR
jgi:hypothetical protein